MTTKSRRSAGNKRVNARGRRVGKSRALPANTLRQSSPTPGGWARFLDEFGSVAGDGRSRLDLVISAACFAISAAAAIACAVICLVSSVPVPPVPEFIWAPLVLGLFPSILLSVLLRGWEQSELAFDRWNIAAVVLCIVCFLSGMVQLAFTHDPGQIIHGAYYTINHGTVTRVSHDTYLWAARAGARMYSGGACLAYVIAAEIYASRWRAA